MKPLAILLIGWLLVSGGLVRGDTPDDAPRPVPLTRPEMKRLIEDVKVRTPRIPLPELTDEDRRILGEESDDYESVVRHSYLPWVAERRRAERGTSPSRGSRGSREQDPNMTLDYAFKTELFWIVSRVNNCQYCIGHQESKLLSAGLTEDEIAALDGDWSGHSPSDRAAFAFARKLAHQPHLVTEADIDGLRRYYTDLQILEMVVSISRNNISNRWKEAIGVPQRKDEGGFSRSEDETSRPRGSYLTPTSDKFSGLVSSVAPIVFDQQTGAPTRLTICRRPALESPAEVERALDDCRTRTPRLPLVDELNARQILSAEAPQAPLPQWILLLANFPRDGVEYVSTVASADDEGDLSAVFKAQLAWIIARQDRAWYALGQSQNRLREQGQSDNQIAALDGDWSALSPREQALFTVAKKLAASPVVLTDQDVKKAVKLAGARDVVQTINYTTTRTFFDRVTEAARLRLEQ